MAVFFLKDQQTSGGSNGASCDDGIHSKRDLPPTIRLDIFMQKTNKKKTKERN